MAKAAAKRAAAGPVEGPWALPDGWRWEALGGLGTWTGGGTPSKAQPEFWTDGTVPWVSPKDMKRPLIDSSEDRITNAAIAGSSAKLVPVGSVLCVMRSGILRHTFPVAVNTIDVTLNQDMRALTPRADVNPRYLAYYLQFTGNAVLHTASKAGTTVNSIEASRLDWHPVPLVNQDRQERIVARIDELFAEVDDGEAALARAREDLATWRKALLKAAVTGDLTADWRAERLAEDGPPAETGADLLTRLLTARRARWEAEPRNRGKRYAEPVAPDLNALPPLPDGWAWTNIGQLAIVDSGGTPPGIEASSTTTGEVPWFKVSSMSLPGNETELRVSHWWLSREQAGKANLRIFPSGSLVFPKLGGALLTNKRRLLAQDSCLDLNNMAVSPMPGVGGYISAIFSGIDFADLSDGSVVPQLKRQAVEAITIALPPAPELVEIVARLDAAFGEAGELAAGMVELKTISATLRQSILAAAFRGELA